MALSQTDVDALEAALASGELTVKIGDRQVTYQTTADLLSALTYIRGRVSAAAGATPGPRHQLADFSGCD